MLCLKYGQAPCNNGPDDQWPVLREQTVLESFADSSLAPTCQRSHQATLHYYGGAVVAWTSSKQPFVALSTAESELIALVESAQRSSSLQPLLDELEQTEITTVSYTDNTAATSLVQLAGGPCRTRHLRIRRSWLRERLGDKWKMFHIPGSVLPADIGTKTLSTARFWTLVFYLDLGEVPSKVSVDKLDPLVSPKPDLNRMKALVGALVRLHGVSPARGEVQHVQESPLPFRGGLLLGITVEVMLGLVIGYSYFHGLVRFPTLRSRSAFLAYDREHVAEEEKLPSLGLLPQQSGLQRCS